MIPAVNRILYLQQNVKFQQEVIALAVFFSALIHKYFRHPESRRGVLNFGSFPTVHFLNCIGFFSLQQIAFRKDPRMKGLATAILFVRRRFRGMQFHW